MDAKLSAQNQNQNKVLQVSTTLDPQFKLPDDWVVERRCRSKRRNRRSHEDMYYYEAGTGWRFRSLMSVQKHLSGETSKNAKPGNKTNHYIEPETGKQFRSLRSVEKYLAEVKEHTATLEALKAGYHFIPSKSSGSQKEHVSSEKVETSMLGSSSTPAKIKWVLGGPGGIVWNPFMNDSLVPESIKQKWSEAFVFSLIDRL